MRGWLNRVSIAALVVAGLASAAVAGGERAADPPIGADQLVFSVANMDPKADPRIDFYRYANGRWADRAVRPARLASINIFEFMSEHLKGQMKSALRKAADDAATAPKGSPVQQVGDFYRAYMDVARIDALGIEPLKPELAKIDAIATRRDLSAWLGHFTRVTGDSALASIVPFTDLVDAKKVSLYFISGAFMLDQGSLYDGAPDSPQLLAYRKFLEDVLKIAGYDPARAAHVAERAVLLEKTLHAAQLTPVEAVDPRNGYQPVAFADLQKQIPEIDLTVLMQFLGAPVPDIIVQTEPRYLPVLSGILRDWPLDDIKEYLRLKLIVAFKSCLTTKFDEPTRALDEAILGVTALPPREERAQGMLRRHLGHPVSRVYVENFFSEDARARATDMVGRIKAAFEARMKSRAWLTDATRKAALDKLDRLVFRMGYPDTWIDYSSVRIVPDNVVANVMSSINFEMKREIAKIGKPVVADQFNDSNATLPIIINAAYNPLINGFEVPAAILQPGIFDPAQDAAVNLCRIGAVLGHEMTHGFDSGGRLFDASGNMRDWWTPEDAKAFEKEAQKLIDQANGFEVLPGLKANGPLNVKENMADVGGINFAYDALTAYLKDHPAENVPVEGMTPAQRCFVSWAQMWAEKATDQYIRAIVGNDNHPPGRYRAVAALQHVDAFYDAFGIKPGDPMYLPPDKRVHAW
ncbi:MAG: M13 family metallopeptidase [Rhizobiales bacterium]|nr:M13 family metallopeptidase [Hyphomicrobiales bacterium]